MDIASKIIKYEANEMTIEEEVVFFAELIKSGLCWNLQGYYGRTAKQYIEDGVISTEGKIL